MATGAPASQSVMPPNGVGPQQSFVDHHHHHHHHHYLFHLHHCFHHNHHHHHHHHHHHYPFCNLKPYCSRTQGAVFPNFHSHVCPGFASLPESTVGAFMQHSSQGLVNSECKEAAVAEEAQLLEENFQEEKEEEEEEEGEEAVFVMTDEWVEFFAKSEAKRKLEKKLAKKKKKKSND